MTAATPQNPLPPRLTKVWVDDLGRICGAFEDGQHKAFDPSGLFRLPVFAPLADRQKLAEVAVIEDGTALGWPNGADLYRGTLYNRGVSIPREELQGHVGG